MINNQILDGESFPPMLENSLIDIQLQRIHKRIQQQYPFISCIEVTVKDAANDARGLHTASCNNTVGRFIRPSYAKDLKSRKSEIIQDLARISCSKPRIDEYISESGFRSGLSVPIRINEKLEGFTLFTALEEHCFTPEIIERMQVFAQVIAQIFSGHEATADTLRSSVSAILQLNNVNQSESPDHLRRVAHYSRLIARQCAKDHDLSDEWIHHLFLFAPLHDIGKVFIPEAILAKPGRLTPDEFEQIKTHTVKGREIIDHMIDSFGYKHEIHYTDLLRNIVTHHHESIDGQGYPHGLQGDEIPLEARIVAVADVFDALMTRRAYKEAWSSDAAFTELRKLAGHKLQAEFIHILEANQDELKAIREAFSC